MNNPVKLSLVALTVAAAIGCAQRGTTDGGPPREPQAASITQIGYGPNARFVTCPIAGCLKPTPKTMVEAPGAGEEPAPRTGSAAPIVPVPMVPTTLVAAASAPEPALVPALVPTPAPSPAAAAKADDKQANDQQADDKPEFDKGVPQRVYINFPVGSARLNAEAKQQLDRLVPYVVEAEKVVIKGRTDERGDHDTNDRLALRRAMAVYDHLKRAAKAGDKPFKLLAKGACCYIARNNTEAGRAANRRAEIDFVVPLQASVSPPRRALSKAHSS